MRHLLFALALLTLAACDSGSGDVPADAARLSGRYTGSRDVLRFGDLVYSVVLAEGAAGAMDGEGTFGNSKGTIRCTGTRTGDRVALTFRALVGAGTGSDTFTATVSDDGRVLAGTITGTYNAGAVPFTLTRAAP